MLKTTPPSTDHLADNRIGFIKFMIGVATITTFFLTIVGALQQDWLDAGINFGLMIIPICLGVLVVKKKNYNSIFSFFVAYVFLILIATLLTLQFEPFDLFWLLIFPLPIFMLKGSKKGLYISLSYASFLAIYFLVIDTKFPAKVYINFFAILGVIIFLSFSHMNWRKKVFYELKNAYKATEEQRDLLRELSIKDELTQINNRRYFNEVFPRELSRCSRSQEYLGFFILDVDFFKRYNDNYGHHAGDMALKNVSLALKTELQRREDYLFRLGGEEFGGIVFGKSEEAIVQKVEQVCKAIRNLAIAHEFALEIGVLTVSIGLTLKNSQSNDWNEDSVYKEADLALYQAKELGRNRVVLFREIGHCLDSARQAF
jgi:diguanylate cyclase (GGDEF)-like protein